ncbi:MAG: hypothetical protein AAFY26_10745 [Cyanobacteria bacterium J06638_22]
MVLIDLRQLQQGLPAITPAFGAALAEACAVCLTEQQHQPGVELKVTGEFTATYQLNWPLVTAQMQRCWNDLEYTTEQGAYGIALLLLGELTEFTVVERSRKGTGFDYWLGKPGVSSDLPFQKLVRLEVSGIRKGNPSQVRTRVKLKKIQVAPTDTVAPAFIVVIEFSQPIADIATS